MNYEYQLMHAYLSEYKDIRNTRYEFKVNAKKFIFARYTNIKKGATRYVINEYNGTLLLSWHTDNGFTFVDVSGDTLNVLNSVLIEQFDVVMPKLS